MFVWIKQHGSTGLLLKLNYAMLFNIQPHTLALLTNFHINSYNIHRKTE
jgi:hypothetical protein